MLEIDSDFTQISFSWILYFSGSLFTNSNWFAFEEERVVHERSTDAVASPSPDTEATPGGTTGGDNEPTSNETDKKPVNPATSEVPESKPIPDDTTIGKPADSFKPNETDKPPEWIKWRESVEPTTESSVTVPESAETSPASTATLPNGNLEVNPTAGVAPPSAASEKPEAEDGNGGNTTVVGGPLE